MTNGKKPVKGILGKLARRDRRMRSTAEAIQTFYERLGGQDQGKLTALWKSWRETMGDDIASLGVPLGHKGNSLCIGTDDSMAMQDLSMQSEDILERANACMGTNFFSDVSVTLLQGKNALSAERTGRSPTLDPNAVARAALWLPEEEKPDLGSLLGKLPADSLVARCYEAHVALAQKNNEP